MKHPTTTTFHSRRGSVLLVALLVAVGLALALGGVLSLGQSSARLATRNFHYNAALELAEGGIEQALWSFNQASPTSGRSWEEWSLSGNTARRDANGFAPRPGATGHVRIFVDQYDPPDGARPRVVAQATIELGGQPAVNRMLEVTLRKRSLFAGGLVARESVRFAGSQVTVDSWHSRPDLEGPVVAYSEAVRRDNGSVASASVDVAALHLSNAEVWGRVATAGAPPVMGPQGRIRGADTPEDVIIDPARISTDFRLDLPTVSAPEGGELIPVVKGGGLGTDGQETLWRAPSIELSGNQQLVIQGQVKLVLTAAPGTRAIEIRGRASLRILEGSSLTVYTEGDLHVAGNGILNDNPSPRACTIWGVTRPPLIQRFDIVGQGALLAAIYAPEGEVTLRGNGDIMGSVVAKDIILTGNAAFHFDEALADYGHEGGFGVMGWREIRDPEEKRLREATLAAP